MSETHPERPIAKRFSQDIFPSNVGFDCKGTKKNAYAQVLCDFFCLVDGALRLLYVPSFSR